MPAPKKFKVKKKSDSRDPLFWRRYSVYLASDEWKSLRTEALRLAGNKCSICKSTERLAVHHLTYERVFREEQRDLAVLCHFHHELAHGRKLGPLKVGKKKSR